MMKRGDVEKYSEQAKAYLEGQDIDMDTDEWERVLLEDESTLTAYMDMLDELQEELPSLENSSAFTERVMVDWAELQGASVDIAQAVGKEEGPRRYRWYEKTVFHYAVAASLTLLIMSSGMFDKLLTGQMELIVPKKDDSPSYSEQIMHATSGWLEKLMGVSQKREEK